MGCFLFCNGTVPLCLLLVADVFANFVQTLAISGIGKVLLFYGPFSAILLYN